MSLRESVRSRDVLSDTVKTAADMNIQVMIYSNIFVNIAEIAVNGQV